MQYIEAPSKEQATMPISVFLAGGITNCPKWQQEVITKLQNEKIALFNPRRQAYPGYSLKILKEQIEWEYKRLRLSNIIAFWFSRGSDNPISLFELGEALNDNIPWLIIGINPEYSRKIDVEIQTSLRRPEIKIVYSLDDLEKEIINNINKLQNEMIRMGQ